MEAFDNLLQRVAKMKKEIWALEDPPEENAALRNNKFVPTASSVLMLVLMWPMDQLSYSWFVTF